MRDATLIRRNLLRRKLRFFLLFLSIVAAFFLYGALNTVRTAISYGSDNARGDRQIVANKINFTQPLPISHLDEIRGIAGVARATPSVWFGGYYREPKNFVVSYAVDMPNYLAVYSEYAMPPAQRAACLARRDGLLVGRTLATQYGWTVGQIVTLMSGIHQQADGSRAWPFTVCGVFTDTRTAGADINALMHYDYFNGGRAFDKDTISLVTLRLRPGADAEQVQRAIDGRFANSAFATKTASEGQFTAAFARQFGDIGLIVSLVTGAAFVSMILIVGSSMLLAVRERTRELAIMKTLGFPRRRLLKLVVGEALLIAALGGLVGLSLAQAATFAMSRSAALAAFAMQPSTWVSGIAWIVGLTLLVSAAPAYRALTLNVITGLGRR